MAARPLHNLLPWNLEIHNFTTIELTAQQSQVLGMGLKFQPTLKPPTEAWFDSQVKDFCRKVRLQDQFADQPPDPNLNPRWYVPTGWNPPQQNLDLEDGLFCLRKELLDNLTSNKPHWNKTSPDKSTQNLTSLVHSDIRVVAMDKILGPALMSTDWVHTEALKHLHDELSYSKVSQEDWYVAHHNVIASHDRILSTYNYFIPPNLGRFLCAAMIILRIQLNPMRSEFSMDIFHQEFGILLGTPFGSHRR